MRTLALAVVLALAAPAATADTSVHLSTSPCQPDSTTIDFEGGAFAHAHANRTVAGSCVGAGADVEPPGTCRTPLDPIVGEPLPCLPCAPVCFHGTSSTPLRAQRL